MLGLDKPRLLGRGSITAKPTCRQGPFCAIRTDHKIVCWRYHADGRNKVPGWQQDAQGFSNVNFDAIATGGFTNCGILSDDGGQYEVFTPEEGGTFRAEGSSLSAEPGVVPNGELIGLRITEGDVASNVGKIHHRYQLGGMTHDISEVDSSGSAVTSYQLNQV